MQADLVALARNGDAGAFAALMEPHRNAMRLHCYRMVGSYEDAEDLVQDAYLRAWRNLHRFEGRSSLRTWLHSVATNAALDFLRKTTRKPEVYPEETVFDHGPASPPPRMRWLQPYPDNFMETHAGGDPEPASVAVTRETIELVFIFALQYLPARQRAVFILRDVLELSAAETAEMLEMSVASVNSALQRAKATLREHLPARRGEWPARTGLTGDEERVLHDYMRVAAEGDVPGMARLLHRDIQLTMPPLAEWFVGRETFMAFAGPVFDPASPRYVGEWRHLPFRVNRMPAAAGYIRKPGDTVFRAQVLDVLRIEDGEIVEITAFSETLFPMFGLPETLS